MLQKSINRVKNRFSTHLKNAPTDRAAISAERAVALIVALTVGSIVAAFLLPIGIDELVGVDTSAWSSGAQSLWAILDVIVVLALFMFFIGVALKATSKAT